MFTLIQEALSFDDISLVPNFSDVSLEEINLNVALTSAIHLNIPLLACISSYSLTEANMAIALAKQGGMGIICKSDDIQAQLSEVKKVKRACHDSSERLRVGGSIGVQVEDQECATRLIEAGVDVLVVEALHGYSQAMLRQIAWLKKQYPAITLIVGNVLTAEAALALHKIGVDAIKVGTNTRLMHNSSVAVPSVTAIANIASALQHVASPMSIIADGICSPQAACKALAAGAHMLMCNDLFTNTQALATMPVHVDLKRKAVISSTSTNINCEALEQFLNKLRRDMTYLGCRNLKELREKVYFVKINAV